MPLTKVNESLRYDAYTLPGIHGGQVSLSRQRKTIAALFLGVWLFALFAGMATACQPQPSCCAQGDGMAMAAGHGGDEDLTASCLQFCHDDIPILTKYKLVQDQPAGTPLLVASIGVLPPAASASAVIAEHVAHPPSDIPLLLRTLRFAL
jgi:hypothetical protein